jgi:hypothetical protein
MDNERKATLDSMIDAAYADLTAVVRTQSDRQQRYVDAKTALELAKASKIIGGEIQGKNETERKASEATVLALEIDAVKASERNLELQTLNLRLSEIEAERIRWKIRLELIPETAKSEVTEKLDLPF